MRAVAAASFRLLEPFLSVSRKTREDTTRALRAARMGTFPEWYLSLSYLSAGVAGFVLFLVAALVLWLGVPRLFPPLLDGVVAVGAGIFGFSAVRLAFLAYPRMRAKSRTGRIDAEYPSVVILCYALARGGLNTLDVFRVVAEERDTYGEISKEFALVVRDIDVFGHDIITALHSASATTPSGTLKAFFEGLATILSSGADPRDFFKRQAEVELSRAEVQMASDIEQAGMLAEVYVSSFLVIPLLLIVVLSGLAALGNGMESFIPLVVYGLIPMGTFVYLMMLEVSMPPDSLHVPRAKPTDLEDFGVDAVPPDLPLLPPPWKLRPDEKALGWRFRLESFRRRLSAGIRQLKAKLLERPVDAIELSGSAALLVVLAGGAFLFYGSQASGGDLVLGLTAVFLVAGGVAAIPVSVFHEARLRRARRVEMALPEMLSKLSGFNERGIGLLQSFQILGRSASGPLAHELRAVERDVSWNGHLGNAIRRLRARVNTLRMTKLGILLERASAATGNMKEVLDIAASDATRTESLRSRKRKSMLAYVIVIYLVFFVFLYVLYMVSSLFYGDAAFAVSAGPGGGAATAIGGGYAPDEARLLFLHAVVIQGIASGLVAGRLGEGYLLSGLKHAAILGFVAWAVFRLGVI